MTALDYTILAVYLLGMISLGGYFCRGQKSLREYLLGGRSIPWWAAAFSGIATMASAVGYLGAPGQAFHSDLTYWQLRLAIPFAILALCLLFIPFFYKLDVYTAYEYLERRFDLKTRVLAASLFTLLKCGYLGIVIFAPALVLSRMTGVSEVWIVLMTGAVTTLYTMLGGIRGVVWTDSLQLGVLVGGAVAAFWILTSRVQGGVAEVFRVAGDEGKLRMVDLSPSFTAEFTFWGGMIGGTFLLLSQYGVDQAELQRFLTTTSVRHARLAVSWTIVASAVYGSLLFLIGSALYVFYLQNPDKGGLALQPDQVFPKFILDEMPPGLRGVLIAGVLSAGMSTISSVLNSLATVALRDFHHRLSGRDGSVPMARAVTVGFGALGTGVALFGDWFGGILVASGKISNFFGGSLVGIFLLGMLAPRVNGTAAFWGALTGFAGVAWAGSQTRVSWLWYGAIAAGVAFGSGLLYSQFLPAPESAQVDGLTWRHRRHLAAREASS